LLAKRLDNADQVALRERGGCAAAVYVAVSVPNPVA